MYTRENYTNKFSWKLYLLVVCILLVDCILVTPDIAHTEVSTVKETNASSVPGGIRQYSNILIKWVPDNTECSLEVTITMGSALIGLMHFTPDTLQKTLNYSNPPQSATGVFIVEFNALGKGGKLYCENFKWKTMSDEGNLTSLIGTWHITK